jgi:hypothetical protein
MVRLTPVITATNNAYWYFAAEGSTLVWANPNQARIYDLGNPFEPKQIGLIEETVMSQPRLIGDYVDVEISGTNYLWHSHSEPERLTPVEPGLLSGWPQFVSADQRVYLIDRSNPEQWVMRVIDMAAPTAARTVAAVDWNLAEPHTIQVIGGFVYALYDGYLAVVDISNAPVATEIKTIPLAVTENSQIEVSEGRAYLYTDPGIVVLDVTTPANPEQIGEYRTQYGANYFDVVGNYVYLSWQICDGHVNEDGSISSGCGQGIELVDFTNPAEPLYLGVIRLGMPADWIVETYVTAEAAYIVTSSVIYALDLNRPVFP